MALQLPRGVFLRSTRSSSSSLFISCATSDSKSLGEFDDAVAATFSTARIFSHASATCLSKSGTWPVVAAAPSPP
eukprot:CAMPEP_0185756016 /NCGR_PEP_ID=MMETSP1174-20130828/14484_1 /TAXON_ID=35687 /ORGANISM="Dictyocha speculum, Strain CCMP1381" /LENGTH=74 /DNA_ID=CAMNT_0028434807 /DNA_START=35 /DNA_END=256 /DNA_ORIENTATION=+